MIGSSTVSLTPFAVVSFSLALVCCGRRIEDSSGNGDRGESEASDDATNTSNPGATNTSDPGATSTGPPDEPPLECRDGWVACPDETQCVNLFGNVGHCGECNHACEGIGTTARCSQGKCEPGIWPCIPRDQSIVTCAEACASVGETCAVDAYCSGFAEVWLTDGPNDNDPQQNLEACLNGFSGQYVFRLGCDDPIDWEYEVGGQTVVGVACCCTQP
jgi:hypothetical protein